MRREWRPKAARISGGSFAAVIRAYLASPKFAGLSTSTQRGYRQYLQLAERPDILGAINVEVIRPALVQGFLDGLADRPGAQLRAQVAIKAVERWALVRDLLPFPITTGTEVIRSTGGHRPWSDAQVALVEANAQESIARAVTLAANTGQRGSDLIRMRWSDIEEVDGRPGINVIQRKTGLVLWIPFTQPLQAAVVAWERRPTFLLLKPSGEPWGRQKQLSQAWERERAGNPALSPCGGLVLHGLRATAVVRLSRSGASVRQIGDMVGMSQAMVERYCRFASQRDSALAAVHYLDRTPAERGNSNPRKSTT